MKAGCRPQYYRIRRLVQMVRESAETDYLPNSSDFMKEFEVSRRTVARDLDFLRDEERAPLEYDDARHGFRLSDETYTLPPVTITRREAFSFTLARKLLRHYEGTPLHLDMRAVLDKIAESLEGDVSIEPDWLSEHVDVLPEDHVRIDPEVWAQMAGCVERCEVVRVDYQTFTGQVTAYELNPFHLLGYHGNWYVLARNAVKDLVETFALSRFRRIEAVGQTFSRPADFNAATFSRQAFGITGGEKAMKLHHSGRGQPEDGHGQYCQWLFRCRCSGCLLHSCLRYWHRRGPDFHIRPLFHQRPAGARCSRHYSGRSFHLPQLPRYRSAKSVSRHPIADTLFEYFPNLTVTAS